MDVNDVDDELAGLALHALGAEELTVLEAELARDPDRRHRADRLLAVVAELAAAEAVAPPSHLLGAVRDAAFRTRPAGVPAGLVAGDAVDEVEALQRAVDDVAAELDELGAPAWDEPEASYGTVKALVAHLVGVERQVGFLLGLWPPDGLGEGDHRATTAPMVARLAPVPGHDVARRWRTSAQAVVDELRTSPGRLDEVVDWYGTALTVRALTVVRTFELWNHADDVRRALRRPVRPPTVGQLRHMTTLAATLLPPVIEHTGAARPGLAARLVLTGRGGGTWVVPFGASHGGPSHEAVTLVADAVDFCRVVAARLDPADLHVDVDGDEELAHRLLVAARALALD